MENNDTQVKTIRREWKRIICAMTDPAKDSSGNPVYICPLCLYGTGGYGGIISDPDREDGAALRCPDCGFTGDIIDLYGKSAYLDRNAALLYLSEITGIPAGDADTAETAPRSPQNRTDSTDGTTDRPHSASPEGSHGATADGELSPVDIKERGVI